MQVAVVCPSRAIQEPAIKPAKIVPMCDRLSGQNGSVTVATEKATADLSTPLRCAQDDSRFEIVPVLPLNRPQKISVIVGKLLREHPAGAEARLYFQPFSARLKSCPFTKPSKIRV
jgi:hypothetical protein